MDFANDRIPYESLANVAAKIDRRTAIRPQIYDLLLRAIVSVDLPPGTPISKNDLSRAFGVSRTPIQEVLLRLEGEGLVEIYPQSGTCVSRLNVQEIKDALFLREMVEPAIVEALASDFPAEANDRLKAIITAQRAALARGNHVEIGDLDGQFHQMLCMAAKRPGVWRVILSARAHMARIRKLSVEKLHCAQTAIDEHAEILACIAAGNGTGAATAMRTHTRLNLQHLEVLKKQFPDYFNDKN